MKQGLKICLTTLFVVVGIASNAQLASYDYNDETKVKFNVRYASINTSGISEDSVKDLSALLIRVFEFDKINPEVGGYNASNRWAFIPETFILAIIDGLNGGDFTWGQKNLSTNIGDFILGWHNNTWNIVYTENISLAAGVHWGDYFLGFEPYNRTTDNYDPAQEPAGWYGVLGPAVMMDYNILNRAVLHLEGGYGLSLKFKDYPDMVADKSYPNPHFLNITAQIRSNSFVYGGMEFIRSVNRGSNTFNASRTDFFIGVWF